MTQLESYQNQLEDVEQCIMRYQRDGEAVPKFVMKEYDNLNRLISVINASSNGQN